MRHDTILSLSQQTNEDVQYRFDSCFKLKGLQLWKRDTRQRRKAKIALSLYGSRLPNQAGEEVDNLLESRLNFKLVSFGKGEAWKGRETWKIY